MKTLAKSWLVLFAVYLSVTAFVLVCALYFAGVSGEVFLVDERGSVRPAPGAQVAIYRSDGSQKTAAGYLVSDASGFKDYTDRLLKVAKAERENRPEGKITLALNLVQQSYCHQLSLGRGKYLGSAVETMNADRNGRFSARLKPGDYIVFVEGQAGTFYAVWLQDVRLKWREEVRLVEPQCKYSAE